jgi:uridine kinase
MIGDNISLKPHHFIPAKAIYDYLNEKIGNKFTIALGGESGCGKSTLSAALGTVMEENGLKVGLIHIDDYFKLPPHTNHLNRERDLANVGMHEVNMEKLQKDIDAFKSDTVSIIKPLVHYQNNEILEENFEFSNINVLIIEGTYTLALDVDCKIFMLRNYKDTLSARIERGRDPITPFVENVLEIEHEIISKFEQKANFVIQKDYSVEIKIPLV